MRRRGGCAGAVMEEGLRTGAGVLSSATETASDAPFVLRELLLLFVFSFVSSSPSPSSSSPSSSSSS